MWRPRQQSASRFSLIRNDMSASRQWAGLMRFPVTRVEVRSCSLILASNGNGDEIVSDL